jgi:hypothetical protein
LRRGLLAALSNGAKCLKCLKCLKCPKDSDVPHLRSALPHRRPTSPATQRTTDRGTSPLPLCGPPAPPSPRAPPAAPRQPRPPSRSRPIGCAWAPPQTKTSSRAKSYRHAAFCKTQRAGTIRADNGSVPIPKTRAQQSTGRKPTSGYEGSTQSKYKRPPPKRSKMVCSVKSPKALVPKSPCKS